MKVRDQAEDLIASKASDFLLRHKESLWSCGHESAIVNDGAQRLKQILSEDVEVDKGDLTEDWDELADAGFIQESVDRHRDVIGKVLDLTAAVRRPIMIHASNPNLGALSKVMWCRV